MANDNHDELGRFAAGSGDTEATAKTPKGGNAAAARGDHQRAQTHDGRGYPVAPHRGAVSVGTHASAGGSGGSGGSMGPNKIKGHFAEPSAKYGVNMRAARTGEGGNLSTTVGERVQMRQQADQNNFKRARPRVRVG